MSLLAEGFTNPVMQAQAIFRAVMNAFAFPGRVQPLPVPAAPPAPLMPEQGAILLTLCDADTLLYLGPSLRTEDVAAYLRFHTGTRFTQDASEATFAAIDLARDGLHLEAFAPGTPDYPDRSTTLIAAVESHGGGAAFTLRGPGIARTAPFSAKALPDDFDAQWAKNRGLYPLGVDMLLTARGGVLGLPRTTTMLKGAR